LLVCLLQITFVGALRPCFMPIHHLASDRKIETKQTRFGKWIYIIHLKEVKSQPSRRFPTQEDAINDAEKLLSYMA